MPLRTLVSCYLILLLFWGTGCQQDTQSTDNQRLFSEFFVRYLEPEQQLKAYASFFEGDSIKTAAPKTFLGGVSFQGMGMESRNLLDQAIRYTITSTGDYQPVFEFKYKNDDREEIIHSISMSPIEDFVVAPQVRKSEGMTLTVEGGALAPNESLVLLFNDENNKASSITINGPTQGIKHDIPASNLSGLNPGKCQLYLVKKKSEIAESSDAYTVSSIEFYSNTTDVEIME